MVGLPESAVGVYPLINAPNFDPQNWSLERTGNRESSTIGLTGDQVEISVTSPVDYKPAVYTTASSVLKQ
jgi:hypothetical protein